MTKIGMKQKQIIEELVSKNIKIEELKKVGQFTHSKRYKHAFVEARWLPRRFKSFAENVLIQDIPSEVINIDILEIKNIESKCKDDSLNEFLPQNSISIKVTIGTQLEKVQLEPLNISPSMNLDISLVKYKNIYEYMLIYIG